jgi:hypothetical protein
MRAAENKKEGESDRSRTMNSRRDLGTRENRGRITCNQVPNRPSQCRQGKTPTSELWLDGQVSPKKLGTAAVTGLLMVATVGHRRREPPQNPTPAEGTHTSLALLVLKRRKDKAPILSKFNFEISEVMCLLISKLQLHRNPLAHPRLAEHARRN